jgi:hypothetical protein
VRPLYSPRAAILFDPLLPRDTLDELSYFDVEIAGTRVGVVQDCERDEGNRPTSLIVAEGLFGFRRFAVPVEEIAEIDRVGKRVVLHPGAVLRRTPIGSLFGDARPTAPNSR